jgi:hypothetical protein
VLVFSFGGCGGQAGLDVDRDGGADAPGRRPDATDLSQGGGGATGSGGAVGTGGISRAGGASGGGATGNTGGAAGAAGAGSGGSAGGGVDGSPDAPAGGGVGGSPDAPAGQETAGGDGPARADGDATIDRASVAMDLPSQPDANPLCGVAGTVVKPVDLETFLSYLVGRWFNCGGAYVLGKSHDGIEFAADGSWYFLFSDGSGGFARGAGFDGGGTWQVLADNHFQLNMDLAGGGGNAFSVAFQVDPSAMRMTGSMAGATDYVRISPDPTTTVRIDGGAAVDVGMIPGVLPAPSEAKLLCGKPGTVVKPTDLASFLSFFVGRWTHCSGLSLLGRNHEGIEFVADGTWYFLHADGNGGFARGAGFDGGGSWEVLADNNYQVNIALAGGGGNALFLAFQIDPLTMRMDQMMVGSADYVKTGANPATTVDGGGAMTSDAPS